MADAAAGPMSPSATAASRRATSRSARSAPRSLGIAASKSEASPGLTFNAAQTATVAIRSSSDSASVRSTDSAAAAAESVLRTLAESEDDLMATVAVWAALKVKPGDASLFEAAIPRLRGALRADREVARLEAAVALGDIGPAAASAIPILELVSEDDPVKQVREAAAAALDKIRAR